MSDWRDEIRIRGIPVVACDQSLVEQMVGMIEALPPQPAMIYVSSGFVASLKGWGVSEAMVWLHGNAKLSDGLWLVRQDVLGAA